jgi:hypothetical protein
MASAGGFGSIARLLTEAPDTKAPRLRSGQLVQARVLKKLAPSKWLLGIGGRVMSAYSERALAVGMRFQAQVRIRAGTLFLDPQGNASSGDAALRFIASEGLPRDAVSLTIVRALLRSGMALDPARIRNLYTFFKNRENVSQRSVRAYLLMQEKGLEPSQRGLDRFLDALDGFSGRHGGEGHAGGREAGDEQAGTGRDGSQKRRRRQSEPKEPEEAIKAVAHRREDDATDLLHAFNHLRDDGGHWIVVPFSLEDDEDSYRGSMRIRFAGRSPSFERAIVSMQRGEGDAWELELVGRGEGRRARLLYPGDAPPAENVIKGLERALSRLGVGELDVEPEASSDGFSTDDGLDILKGIDTEA